MPSATASPCSRREPNPVSASRAWPKVWPKLRRARSPSSRSSPATISAFIAQLVITARRSARGNQIADGAALGFEPSKKLGVPDQAVFDDFGVAGEKLAVRQAGQGAGVGEDEPRLVEGADQVFARPGVDAGLAADRAVDLRQQGRRDLHEIDAAQQCRGGKPGEVADDAAAERHQHRAALDADRQNVLGEPPEMREVLGFLAGRQQHRLVRDPGCGEAVPERREVMAGDILVGDDDGLAAAQQRRELIPGSLQQLRADQNVVAAGAQLDPQFLDRFHHPTISV